MQFIGKFDESDLNRFVRNTMRGRGNIRPTADKSVAPPDATAKACATLLADILDDGTDEGGDEETDVDLAEFLQETVAAQEVGR